MELVGALLAVTICVALLLLIVRSANNSQEEEHAAKLDKLSPEISRLHARITHLSSYESGYLMKKDWDAFLRSAAPTLAALAKIPAKVISKSPLANQITLIQSRCQDSNYRARRNADYKASELRLCNGLLSNIDGGKSLDPQQRDAIVTDEYSNLVIAGAGSGKTSVIVGKVKYLVERWHVDPSEILVTSFTRASVDDLKSRIEGSGVRGVSAKTFHALGLSVLGDVAVAEDNALSKHVTSYLSKQLIKSPTQAAAFLEFFGMRSLASDDKSPDTKEAEVRMKLLKAQDMRTLKGFVQEARHEGNLETLYGERVKSIEELMIANFLFLNGVAYQYEATYPHDIPASLSEGGHRAYTPDFYLTDYDIWLEHFGIDENGRVPWMKSPVEEQAYIDGMAWKREVHAACGTRLIESYSYWNNDQDLLNKLERLLVSNGVRLEIDPQRNADICSELLRNERFFSSMTQMICTFISLVKSSNKTAPEVDDKARVTYRGSGEMWHRYDLFTRFAWPIMESYQRSLTRGRKPKVDFDDMINKAAERIRKEGYDTPYRYIIVDEYQDISLSRFGLLSAIRDATGAKLMCVGDDWQAIYRFAGSDVTLFTNFGKLVGYHEEMRIERTYRNSQKLVDVASKFVLKNPHQLRKNVTSKAQVQDRPPIAVVSLEDQRAAFTFALNDLLASPGGGGEIKVLGRNGHDLERIFPGFEPFGNLSFRDPKKRSSKEAKFDKVITYSPKGAKPIEIGYMTVHKSKGLQADNVIVIGLLNERYGFPNMVADDPILELLLADSDSYAFAEERRLFYVALTRTKNRVWLVTGDDSGNPGISMFADELRRENREDAVVFYSAERSGESALCPRCGGVLIRRSGAYGDFVGCSNFPFCDKTYADVRVIVDKKQCPVCGGWLTRRKRSDGSGEFYGCTNYPTYCQFTMNLDGTGGSTGRPMRGTRLSGSIPVTRVNVEYDRARASVPGRSGRGPAASGVVQVPRAAQSPRVSTEFDRPRTSSYGSYSSTRQDSTRSSAPNCPKCGATMVVRSGYRGKFYGCPNYPSCTGTRSIESQGKGSQRSQYGSWKSGSAQWTPTCPKCGAVMVLRNGKRGKFYGCPNFPKCTGTRDYRG